jgi:transcriptional regulator with XRE-family HTH domain
VNERLQTAMMRAGVSAEEVARAAGVDAKTVSRWVGGRVPHRRSRVAVARLLAEREEELWPASRPDVAPGSPATGEVVAAWARRADVPHSVWRGLLAGSRERIDVLGYAAPLVWELEPRLAEQLGQLAMKVRIALCDPDCAHALERDTLEQLDGTLPGRIRNALTMIDRLRVSPGVQVGLHQVHLYNAIYRFDDRMIVTPYLYRARGFEHPTLQLRRLSPFGIFERYAAQFEDVWATVRPVP